MRSPRHDSGLCRICCRRKNLNAKDNIVRHSHMGYRCHGSDMRPAPDTVERVQHPRDTLPAVDRRIRLLENQIEAGRLDAEGLKRAKRTIQSLRSGKAFDCATIRL